MKKNMDGRCEILSPAGNLEKLKMAVMYGADAVYVSDKRFGLRAAAGNFDSDEMAQGVKYAHEHGCRVYQTMNIFAHNSHLQSIPDGIRAAVEAGVDALIVSDAGIIRTIRTIAPDMEIHLSTQASCTNSESMKFWIENGCKRVVLARETGLKEISQIREALDLEKDERFKDAEIEAFVHGAMCVSYSGRCLLSNYMTGRNANQGMCAHPCRWKYSVVEEQRPGEYMPVEEDANGTYIFNSRDLCMIKHIPELLSAGVNSLKIEGRNKSAYYVAAITSAYRKAVNYWYDCLAENSLPEQYELACKQYAAKAEEFFAEVCKASHRHFSTGFYFGRPDVSGQVYDCAVYERDYVFCGLVVGFDEKTGYAIVEQRNRFFVGDDIEVMNPKKENFVIKVNEMWNESGGSIDVAPHAQMKVLIDFGKSVEIGSILRKPDTAVETC